jgi:ribosome assembly protein YihI (activator of Der GTPase)
VAKERVDTETQRRDSFSKSAVEVKDPSAGSHVPRPLGGVENSKQKQGVYWGIAEAAAVRVNTDVLGRRRRARAEAGRSGSGMRPVR